MTRNLQGSSFRGSERVSRLGRTVRVLFSFCAYTDVNPCRWRFLNVCLVGRLLKRSLTIVNPVKVSVAATYAQLGCFFLPLASPCRPRFCAMGNDLRPRSLASELVLLTQAVEVFCVHKLLLLVYKSQYSLSNLLKKSCLNRAEQGLISTDNSEAADRKCTKSGIVTTTQQSSLDYLRVTSLAH